ncbi:hypothetical protein C2G38_2089217 [Gigaspora rosea]|uniref:Uncharacterized protein n=1 Tax=Gigaspora rosea TaxID=44941 RepID=A0A397V5A0_9GLOM|nr:hypothetical protein C2G38_2089217 [Gigaspora rosea]
MKLSNSSTLLAIAGFLNNGENVVYVYSTKFGVMMAKGRYHWILHVLINQIYVMCYSKN